MDKIERILGLDVGTVRIGSAISDPLGIFARELEVIERKNDKFAIEKIEKICAEYGVKTIVVGVPYNMDGSTGPQAKNCIDFANLLKANFKIEFVDETLTSYEAEELLKKEKVRYTRNKGLVDLKSACLILSEYLNYRK